MTENKCAISIKPRFDIEENQEKEKPENSGKTENKNRLKGAEKYFYCVVPCGKKKNFGQIGMNDSEVYTLPYNDIAAVISDSSLKEYELTEEYATRHEEVIRHLMEERAVVPVEFGTLIKNEKILTRLMAKTYDPVKACLKLVDNAVELGVKVVLSKESMFDNSRRKEYVSDILGSLKTKAKHVVIGDLFSDRLILNVAFLVNKDNIDAFSDEVMILQEKYFNLKFLYSGPWAPHNFVYIKIGAKGVEITKK
jgi:galactokinase